MVDVVSERAPDGFDKLEDVISQEARFGVSARAMHRWLASR